MFLKIEIKNMLRFSLLCCLEQRSHKEGKMLVTEELINNNNNCE